MPRGKKKAKEESISQEEQMKHVALVTVLVVVLMGVTFAMGYAVGGTKVIERYIALENEFFGNR